MFFLTSEVTGQIFLSLNPVSFFSHGIVLAAILHYFSEEHVRDSPLPYHTSITELYGVSPSLWSLLLSVRIHPFYSDEVKPFLQ